VTLQASLGWARPLAAQTRVRIVGGPGDHQAVGAHPERVAALQRCFAGYRSNDEYDSNIMTHVMACSALVPGRLIRTKGS
jgi:hypothetical protein